MLKKQNLTHPKAGNTAYSIGRRNIPFLLIILLFYLFIDSNSYLDWLALHLKFGSVYI